VAGEPEARFDHLKAVTDQLALLTVEAAEPLSGPWVRRCGDPGPYALARPTPKSPHRLQIVDCTRPDRHGGAFHAHATADERVLASWGLDGTPNFPPTIKREGPNAANHQL
jgi:hypothetical protein